MTALYPHFGGHVGEQQRVYPPAVVNVMPMFPVGASASAAWVGDTTQIFGGNYVTGATAPTYIDYDVALSPGLWTLSLLGLTSTNRGIVVAYLDGVLQPGSIDQYSASATRNVTGSITLRVLRGGKHRLRLYSDSKHGSSTGYVISASQIQLSRLDSAAFLTADPQALPVVIDVPVFGTYSATNEWTTWSATTTQGFGGVWSSSTNQGAYVEYQFWAPAGSYTLAVTHLKITNRGVYSVYIDGIKWGQFDGYDASTVANVTNTLTGIIAKPGIHTVKLLMADKNASSSAYVGAISHIQFRSVQLHGNAGGILRAPEVANLYPWMGTPNAVATWSWTPVSTSIYYGVFFPSSPAAADVQGNALGFPGLILRPGLYSVSATGRTASDRGITTPYLDGVAASATWDWYFAGSADNVLQTATVRVVGTTPHTLTLQVNDKNASSTGYRQVLNFIRLVRIGD